MTELGEIAERAVGSPVAPPPSFAMLKAGADRRRHTARRRRFAGIATITALFVLTAVMVARSGRDESSLSVVGPSPQTTASTTTDQRSDVVPAITDRALYGDPAATSAGLVLSPAGPYVAGQEVDVRVDDPRGQWDPNSAARQCAVIDGEAEICDIRQSTVGWQKVLLRSDVLGPDGLLPCDAPSVACHVVVVLDDALSVGSAPIEITGPDPAAATLEIAALQPLAATGTAEIRVDGVAPRPESDALIAQLSNEEQAQFRRLEPSICRFRSPEEPGYARHPWDCNRTSIGETSGLRLGLGETSSSGTITLDRVFFGVGGWQDCGTSSCVLVITRTNVVSLAPPATMAESELLTAMPLRFDPAGTPRALPALSIDGTSPYANDGEVTVHGTGFPIGPEIVLAWCGPGSTSDYGAVQLGPCPSGGTDVDVAPDGTFTVTVRLRCAMPDRRCLLAWIPGEGSPPYASVPYEVRE